MEIMIRNINGFILLFLVSFFISCKKNEDLKETSVKKKNTIESVGSKENSQYKTWFFSSQNNNSTYKDIRISISADSIKVINGNKLICSGEILQKKSTFTEYFKSAKNGNLNREQLVKDYNFNFGNDIIEISNIYGDLAEKGCLFPFNNMFIVDNHLFFYDKGYYCFIPNEDVSETIDNDIKTTNIQLPYSEKIDIKNVSYKEMEISKVKGLEDFSCDGKMLRFIVLPEFKGVNFIMVPLDCGDNPYRFFLLTIKDNSVVSNLYVEGELYDPENPENVELTNFSIDKNYIIQVKTIEQVKGKVKSETVINYKINESGKILKI
ncbi:hypothetical protein [Flavobacterium tyrosinilyticum]|uniref:hypothetical protein n=1 Tax=Flavobacterium tyrosinilyticum TaxID=1658740 RepID=UPI00202F1700|nr:hypothetical protein [Flavobacterium tyrosinilyticum]MCM0666439.1 hypothetical protein [Flavobacterium tyrosinilyticum]